MPTFDQLLAAAAAAYPDPHAIPAYVEGDVYGDTLANFVVEELRSVYDPDAEGGEQFREAVRAMEKAAEDLRAVARGLSGAHAAYLRANPDAG